MTTGERLSKQILHLPFTLPSLKRARLAGRAAPVPLAPRWLPNRLGLELPSLLHSP